MSYKSSYTGAQIDAGIAAANTAVQPSRTVNGHALSADVTVTAADVGLGNVTNESKATMFSTPAFTGNATLSDGNLVIGTSGKGIDFSATGDASGMTSELLNDYEEGTWTPALKFGGSYTGGSYNGINGSYTKIGRMVVARCFFEVDNKGSSTGAATITGLPYTSNSTSLYYNTGKVVIAGGTGLSAPTCLVAPNSTTILLFNSGATGIATMDNTNFVSYNYNDIHVEVVYFI